MKTKLNQSNPDRVKAISPSELANSSEPPLLIDVRSSVEYMTGSALNAQNISLPRLLLGLRLSKWFLPQWFKELPSDRPIAVICLTSHRSPIAAQQLAVAGFTEVYNVDGGMMACNRLGLPQQ